MKSSACSVRAAWARCIGPPTRISGGRSPSKCSSSCSAGCGCGGGGRAGRCSMAAGCDRRRVVRHAGLAGAPRHLQAGSPERTRSEVQGVGLSAADPRCLTGTQPEGTEFCCGQRGGSRCGTALARRRKGGRGLRRMASVRAWLGTLILSACASRRGDRFRRRPLTKTSAAEPRCVVAIGFRVLDRDGIWLIHTNCLFLHMEAPCGPISRSTTS